MFSFVSMFKILALYINFSMSGLLSRVILNMINFLNRDSWSLSLSEKVHVSKTLTLKINKQFIKVIILPLSANNSSMFPFTWSWNLTAQHTKMVTLYFFNI